MRRIKEAKRGVKIKVKDSILILIDEVVRSLSNKPNKKDRAPDTLSLKIDVFLKQLNHKFIYNIYVNNISKIANLLFHKKLRWVVSKHWIIQILLSI